MGNATVIFNLREGTIEVRGPTEDLTTLFKAVRDAAPALKDIRVIASMEPEVAEGAQLAIPGTADERQTRRIMYRFMRRHRASTASERIAILAFCARHRGQSHFSVEDMETWFEYCELKMPASMSYAMADAQRKDGYIENKGRNQWALTDAGEYFVAHSTVEEPPP